MTVCSYDAQVRRSHGTCVGTLKLLYLCPKVLRKNGCCGVIPFDLTVISEINLTWHKLALFKFRI